MRKKIFSPNVLELDQRLTPSPIMVGFGSILIQVEENSVDFPTFPLPPPTPTTEFFKLYFPDIMNPTTPIDPTPYPYIPFKNFFDFYIIDNETGAYIIP